jgi:23S rRNA pseudouridine1911/1915/1917 synthase
LEVRLETGRKHQIRAQLARIGHPIVGDDLYAARSRLSDRSIGLCAVRLTLAHPISREPLTLSLPDSLLPRAVRAP